jgi:hypothetical protein
MLAMFVGLAVIAAVAGSSKFASADDYPCNHTLCYASVGHQRTANFIVEVVPVYVTWDTFSTTNFYAHPVSGHSSEITYQYEETYTTSTWPSGYFSRYSYTYFQGYRADWSCGTTCLVALSNSWDVSSGGDFHLYGYTWYSVPYPYVDDFAQAKHEAGLYPTDGASYANNDHEDSCWNLTVYGATGC